MKYLCPFLLFFLGCAAYNPVNSDNRLITTVKRVFPSVYKITSFIYTKTEEDSRLIPWGSGTAFLIDAERGLVATCYHVVEYFDVYVLKTPGPLAKNLFCTLISFSKVHDLAILQINGDRLKKALKLKATGLNNDLIGSVAWTVGRPYGLPNTATFGRISRYNSFFLYTDCPVNPGNSGGPLLDRQGRVIGIVARTIRGADGMGSAVRVKYLIELLASIDEMEIQDIPPGGSPDSTPGESVGREFLSRTEG